MDRCAGLFGRVFRVLVVFCTPRPAHVSCIEAVVNRCATCDPQDDLGNGFSTPLFFMLGVTMACTNAFIAPSSAFLVVHSAVLEKPVVGAAVESRRVAETEGEVAAGTSEVRSRFARSASVRSSVPTPMGPSGKVRGRAVLCVCVCVWRGVVDPGSSGSGVWQLAMAM